MVESSLTEEKRRAASRRLRIVFVALVGLSGGFVALATGATPETALAAVGGGLLVGAVLLFYLVRVGREWRGTRR
ncbi:hypothetical protein [Haloplanus halobius]|uniref:hypothetical protein n=1 Tax=Haloplanus halobius TaxID=2934938 RepID=UPI00200CAE86|nr:hypothetical protein [Haloplanus sp. XH21]